MALPATLAELLADPFPQAVFNLSCLKGRLTREDYVGAITQLRFLMEVEILDGTIEATVAERFALLAEPRTEEFEVFEASERASDSYPEFLDSEWWKTVRDYVREIRGHRCELCASPNRLHVHHKTYKHHGAEHRHLDDLILLCSDCHAKFHNKLPARPPA